MNLGIKKISASVGALAVAVLAPFAHANLVKDPSFELNDDSWTLSEDAQIVSFLAGFPTRTGDNSLGFLPLPPDSIHGTAQQEVTLVSAKSYDVSFYLFDEGNADFSQFGFTFGDLTFAKLSHEKDTVVPDWTHYFATIAGFGSGSLVFTSDSRQNNIFVDDVSIVCTPGTSCDPVTPPNGTVPEPGTLLLVGAALAAGGAVRRRTQARG